jgi:hypothetical protein
MSNRIDFFQPEYINMALPAGRPVVFVDGQICPFLEVDSVVRAADPEFGWVKLIYNPAKLEDIEVVSSERIETVAPMGKPISIQQVYEGATAESTAMIVPLFAGQIERVDRNLGQKGDIVEIIAKDISTILGRITVYGQRVTTGVFGTVFLAGFKTVFNNDGEPNASKTPIEYEGKCYTVFEADGRYAKHWTRAEVILYLLSEHLPFGRLQLPELDQLEAIMGNQVCEELDVTGIDLVSALRKCCAQAGIRFKFVPSLSTTGPSQQMVFYRPGSGGQVEVNCQHIGQELSVSKTTVLGLQSEKDFWPITHRYIGRGDYKFFEATFDLIKAWDPAGEGGNQSDYSTDAEDFEQVRNVYRKWCLNEAGDYSEPPYNQDDAFDFSWIFETDLYVQRRRKFVEALSTDSTGQSLGYFLQVSYDNGATWQKYLEDFDVLDDECGVWLSSTDLDNDLWSAATSEQLKFRITASVVSDERLTCSIAKGPVNSVADVVDHIVELSNRFAFRRISGRSIFHKSKDTAVGIPDEVDDTIGLVAYIRCLSEAESEVIEKIEVRTPVLMLNYRVGDSVVASPDSRDILGVRLDPRSTFWIERIVMNCFEQCTYLKILRRRA